MTGQIIRNVIATTGAFLLWCGMAIAEPMKCSGEQQICLKTCTTLTNATQLKACVNTCTQRQAACRQSGCWNNGSSTHCGLMRQ